MKKVGWGPCPSPPIGTGGRPAVPPASKLSLALVPLCLALRCADRGEEPGPQRMVMEACDSRASEYGSGCPGVMERSWVVSTEGLES